MKKARRRPRQRLYSAEVDLQKAGAAIRALGFAPVEDDPVTARGWFTRAGQCRRLKATYAGGWKATMSANGSVSWGLRLVSEVKGAAHG
ncbi:hypothetical protein P1X14_21455 [Sphingomonas sp. AOB5]|uniref:hypothetical protein n=1 Tax=Sphingomonas sp. AOB5 TaxID=3034017 RepID=UPI0023F77722|nr:hypothetical protein [Sphingomonas sp. AOB5]MDF7777836.1 hypothetical protein [Sphingomonas sp. AOB5]